MVTLRGLTLLCARRVDTNISILRGCRCASTVSSSSGASGDARQSERATTMAPRVSSRVESTDSPVVVAMKRLIAEGGGSEVMSLAQGVVHWQPPEEAKRRARETFDTDPSVHAYGPCEGLPALREGLKRKLRSENGLEGVEVMVTTGANQAFINCCLSIADSEDSVVLFVPYYFNHLMALQMTEGGPQTILGPCDPSSMLPDVAWLERRLGEPSPPKAVVVVTPNNPTGVIVPKDLLEKMSGLCRDRGTWLVVDNTYENFFYEDTTARPAFVSAQNVINIFSFSKCYGMMGWRMGYLAYDASHADLGPSLLKVQDTIPICPTQISQHMALGALEAGSPWIAERVALLETNRKRALRALSVLGGESVTKSEGAIYLWAKLPEGMDDQRVVERLVKEFKVCIIPGSSCGSPGYIRVAFANVTEEECEEACKRLERGLECVLKENQ